MKSTSWRQYARVDTPRALSPEFGCPMMGRHRTNPGCALTQLSCHRKAQACAEPSWWSREPKQAERSRTRNVGCTQQAHAVTKGQLCYNSSDFIAFVIWKGRIVSEYYFRERRRMGGKDYRIRARFERQDDGMKTIGVMRDRRSA